MSRVAIIVLACSDYESLDVSLHRSSLPTN